MTLAVLLLALAPVLSVEEFRSRLEVIDGLLSTGDIEQVRALARDLQDSEYALGNATIAADAALLGSISRIADGDSERPFRRRLKAAIDALPRGVEPPQPDADPALAARIRRSWDAPLSPGGASIPALSPGIKGILLPEWVVEAWLRFQRWVKSFFPQGEKPGSDAGSAAATAGLIASLAVILMVGLAIRALRRRSAAVPIATEETAAADVDDDPTARESEEWVSHATLLEREGRLREAVRAWYHAALSALISRGLVAYAKGKTNWEYVAAISPGAAFKTGLVNATLSFERSWYGGAVPTPELLRLHRAEVRRCLQMIGKRPAA